MKKTNSTENELRDVGPFTEGLFRTLTGLYTVPTAIRRTFEGDYKDFLNFPKKEKAKHLTGLITGTILDITTVLGAAYEFPEFLYVPLTTNVISGIYEIGSAGLKYVKNKLESKLEKWDEVIGNTNYI